MVTKADAVDTSAPEQTLDTAVADTWLVGIGASAGGLEALSLLVQKLPTDANAVFVVAQHMSPTHKSVLTSLISRETVLPVIELSDRILPEANTIYITPPNKDVVYEEGALVLREPSGQHATPKPSADRLFKSLANGCGERSVGIVLSGTGSDGSYGVQAIREAGGITIAQEPNSAQYDGMPGSAVGTGCIDLTLKPDQIGNHLTKILASPRDWDALQPSKAERSKLQDLFSILMARTNVDFSDYKENTLNRRIARRMSALGLPSYDEYVDFCRETPDEVEALHRDLLISVTHFFRDPDQFEKLRSELQVALEERGDAPLRIWSVGCATGEEAYSLAIILCDLLGGIDAMRRNSIQVFSTDIDQNALEVARRGVYPLSAAQDIPSRYLDDYFIVGSSTITVRPEIRAITLFSRHNVFQDPPFSNVDLVSIRNVMIYFNNSLQERVLSRLHYALKDEGLLFLGTSETVGELSSYFEKRSGADKVHVKRGGAGNTVPLDLPATFSPSRGRIARGRKGQQSPAEDRAAYTEASLARSVAENGFICTKDGKIIEFIGDTTPYIRIQPGVAKTPSVAMLAVPLRAEVQSLIAIAVRNNRRTDGRWHSMDLSHLNRVQIQVFPFMGSQRSEIQCLIAINGRYEEPSMLTSEVLTDDEQRAYVQQIEQEVRATREALQLSIEELQTANEELQSANEELLSTNEEFQATNEELETSNEELQSTNEELLTVNEELQVSSSERQALATELESTLLSAPYAIAFLDQALMVRRASRAAYKLFDVEELPANGWHITQASLPDGFPPLAPLANDVLRLQETRVVPIRAGGLLTTLTMSPVLDSTKVSIGVSMMITQHDAAGFEKIVGMMSHIASIGFWTYDPAGATSYWSDEMYHIFGRDPMMGAPGLAEGLDQTHSEDATRVQAAYKACLETGKGFQTNLRIVRPDGRIVNLRSEVEALLDHRGDVLLVIGVMWDTEKQAENDILLANYERVQDDLDIGFFSVDLVHNQSTWSSKLYEILGHDAETHVIQTDGAPDFIHPDDRDRVDALVQEAIRNGTSYHYAAKVLRADGQVVSCEARGQVRVDENGDVTHVFGSFRVLEKPSKDG